MRAVVVFALAALASCKPSIKGRLVLTADGAPVTIKSALYVPVGTDSFRVEFSSADRDCAWAKHETTGAVARAEVLGSFDLAPVIDIDGSAHWHVVGAGWFSDSSTGHETSGNVGRVDWPVDVTAGAGCNQHVKVDNDDDKHLHMHGDFDAICCGAVPPISTPPMTIKVGAKTYPLSSARTRQEKDGRRHLRISNGLAACADEVGGADIYIDAYANADFSAATSFFVMGQVMPTFGYLTELPGTLPTLAKSGDALDINGKLHTHAWPSADGRFLDFEIHGRVPLTTCPP